jgi:hypothetical protein
MVLRIGFGMEYRGKHFTIDGTVKSGEAATRPSAMTSVVWAIDRALAPPRPIPPTD